MFKIKIIVIDRTRVSFLSEGESLYMKRLKKYARVKWVEVKPMKITKGRSPVEILSEEGKKIERVLDKRDYLVSLDRSGHQFDSPGLAGWLNKSSISSRGYICFIIGGPLGLSRDILTQSDKVLSLSRLTLTHEISRLLCLEQLYRSFTILCGEKYHK